MDGQGDEDFPGDGRCTFRTQQGAEGCHDAAGALQGTPQQGPAALQTDGTASKGGGKGNHQAGHQSGFADVQRVEGNGTGGGTDAGDFQGTVCFVERDPGAQRRSGPQRGFIVAAGGVSAQEGCAFGQGGGHDGPLGETLG